MPDPVSVKAPSGRRRFTVAYKVEILARAAQLRAAGRGGVLALLRKEGLRTSHLSGWRRQFAHGRGQGNRGRPGRRRDALSAEIRRLRNELSSLENRYRKAERMILLQRKYVMAASLKLQRKDRGLLSALIAQVEQAISTTDACQALCLSRRDFYQTIRPLREGSQAMGKRETGEPGRPGPGA